MATAIVARAVHSSLPAVSRGLVWASAAALAAVAVLLVAIRPRRSGWWDTATFAAAAAATGAGLGAEGRTAAGLGLAAAALAGWACLLTLPAPWRVRPDAVAASGRRLLAVVATQSAVLAAVSLARSWHTSALAGIGVALWLAGLAAYAALVAPVARGLAARARAREFLADDWIAMGALAISALAAAELLRMPGVPLHPAVRAAGVIAWSAAWLWVPTLVRLDVRAAVARGRSWPGAERWSMVFPLGMLCAASQALGSAGSLPAVARLGRAAAWIALAAWVAAAAGILAGQGSHRYAVGGRRSSSARPG
jgi:Voltage-dependent anion channel